MMLCAAQPAEIVCSMIGILPGSPIQPLRCSASILIKFKADSAL